MKPAKKILKLLLGLVVGPPLAYVLTIVPALWAADRDMISIRQLYGFYRPMAPLVGSPAGRMIDWYAFRIMAHPSCGVGPSTFLEYLAVWDARAKTSDILVIDVVTDAKGTRYFLNSRPITLDDLQLRLQLVAGEDGTPKDGIFVRVDPATGFMTVFSLLQRLSEAQQPRFTLIPADARAARAGSNQEVLTFTGSSFSRGYLPLFVPEAQPR